MVLTTLACLIGKARWTGFRVAPPRVQPYVHIIDNFNSTCYVKELVDSRSEIFKSWKEEGRSGYGIGCWCMSFPFGRHFYTIRPLQLNPL